MTTARTSLKGELIVGDRLAARRDGSPVRLRRNGWLPMATGAYFSAKSGRHLEWESKLELHDLWHSEVDSEVLHSAVQPFILYLKVGGRLTRYTPDRLDVMADGSQRVVEVKRGSLNDDEQMLCEVACEYLAARGLAFIVRLASNIYAEPRFSAVRQIQRHRRTKLTDVTRVQIARTLADGPMAIGALTAALNAGPRGSAQVCAAAVHRLIKIDLSEGPHPNALVELIP